MARAVGGAVWKGGQEVVVRHPSGGADRQLKTEFGVRGDGSGLEINSGLICTRPDEFISKVNIDRQQQNRDPRMEPTEGTDLSPRKPWGWLREDKNRDRAMSRESK